MADDSDTVGTPRAEDIFDGTQRVVIRALSLIAPTPPGFFGAS
jgi:hypothetical protein